MACKIDDIADRNVLELISDYGMDGLPKVVEILFNEAMRLERSRYLGAEDYERSEGRKGYANGYKPKTIKSRMGELDLQIPQVRDGGFYPDCLEKGLRSERALKATYAEMYIHGVSTREVSAVIEKMGGFKVSSSSVSRATKQLDDELAKWRNRKLGEYEYLFLDARYESVRQCGVSADMGVLLAVGIDKEGKKTILGISTKISEAEVHWRSFLKSLSERGLHGVKLIISDDHTGLKAARKGVFPSIPWQRCQFHLQQNAQHYVPIKEMKKEVAADIRNIFHAPDMEEAERLLLKYIKKYEEKKADSLVKWMSENIREGLTIMAFPEKLRKFLRTNNLAERLSKEIKKRTKKVGIFPNEASCLRLATAVVVEISDRWANSKRHLPKLDDAD
jgi:putative transposase